jgi:predicted DNA-binding protein (MmcQ/YjbR family)
MTIETVRSFCRTLPNVTEDIKWGHDLCFCVWGKMFTVVNLERPHSIAFKCTPETFGELIERPGIIPAPYMARNMWVQEQELGEVLDRRELETLVRTSYELVVAKLPRSKREPATRKKLERRPRSRATPKPSVNAKASAKAKAASRKRALGSI